MKHIFYITILLLFIMPNAQGQEHEAHPHNNMVNYMTVQDYKNRFQRELTKQDSLNFVIIKNDTLVTLLEKDRYKVVSVAYEYKDDTFLKYYKEVAFNHPNDSVSEETSMKYWKDDLKIYFSNTVSKHEKKSILEFTHQISNQVDSLSIYEAKHIKDANYVIYYASDFEYDANLAKNKDASFWVYWNGGNQLNKAFLKVNDEKYFSEALRLAKIKTLLFQSLGYFSLSKEFECQSYFSNCYSNDKQLTNFDFELLKYHYSYGICKGTSLATFEDQHKRAQKALKEHKRPTYFSHIID